MSEIRKLQVTGTVEAPPEKVFALLADPARHAELDGAGMVKGLDDGPRPVSGVGDAFVMNMNQDGIGDYQMRSEVVTFEPGSAIAWAPAIHPAGALSHIIGELDPSGHTYDWSGVQDEAVLALYPRVSEEQMAGSITRIGDALR